MSRVDVIRAADPAAPNVDKTHKLLTTRRFPLYCLTITKSGCTFLKNLLYYLDHDRAHPAGNDIHDHMGDLRRAGDVPAWMITRSPYAFTVLRHPVARFTSLYFDKIYRTGQRNLGPLRLEIAAEAGLDLTPDLDMAGHQRNGLALIDWLQDNLEGDTLAPVNPHWRPQSRRLDTLSHLQLHRLTLEGLEWQLPQHFTAMIPDLAKRMDAVSARNETDYPVYPDSFMSDPIRKRVIELYSDDFEQWDQATRRWERRRQRAAETQARSLVPETPVMRPLTALRVRLNVVTQPKAGCTWVKNLLYAIDQGRPHPNPTEIEADNCLLYRDRTRPDLARGMNVLVLRDPVRRFLSLYFDKIWGDGSPGFGWMAMRLSTNRALRLGGTLSLDDHRRNIRRVMRFLEAEFEKKRVEDLNPHWRPQWVRGERAIKLGFTPFLLEDLEAQMTEALGSRIPGLGEAFKLTAIPNTSPKPVAPEALVDDWLLQKLNRLYAQDIALYQRTLTAWDNWRQREEWPDEEKAGLSRAG